MKAIIKSKEEIEAEKNYRPILFSTPMVKAILEGRKTQTRRTLNSMSDHFVRVDNDAITGTSTPYVRGGGSQLWAEPYIKCRYGKVGDILWVRETWQQHCIETEIDENTWASKEFEATGQSSHNQQNN